MLQPLLVPTSVAAIVVAQSARVVQQLTLCLTMSIQERYCCLLHMVLLYHTHNYCSTTTATLQPARLESYLH
jgi:hypothetical protein